MKAFDKFLVVLLALLIIILSIGLALLAIGWPTQLAELCYEGLSVDTVRIVVGVVAGVLFLICLRLLIAAGSGKSHEAPQPTNTLIQQTEVGGSYITLSALDAMVQKHVRANARVKDCKSQVRAVTGGVSISLKLYVMPDTKVVELTSELQQTLKSYIEQLSGITVTDIAVLVESVSAQGETPRVS